MTAADDTIEAAFRGQVGTFAIDLAFAAPMRGITALFGPSGAGKTTVLRSLAGLHHLPGRLTVGDEVWQDDAAGTFKKSHTRPIGYIFQEPSLFAHLSVEGNLRFGLRRAKQPSGAVALRFDDAVDLLGLAPLLDRATTKLSGGERQRVAVGRALLSQPSVLLMDEPLSALDRMTRDEILPYFETLHANLNIPVLYVSHDLAEVSRLADHMIVLAEGRKIAEGPLGEILERLDLQPATGRFEAGVVVTARVVGHDMSLRMTRLSLNGQPLSMPYVDLVPGRDVRLRVRARDVALATQRPEGISVRNILKGTIVEIAEETETAFAETLVAIGGTRIRARITREAAAELKLDPGTSVFALIKSISFDGRAMLPASTTQSRE